MQKKKKKSTETLLQLSILENFKNFRSHKTQLVLIIVMQTLYHCKWHLSLHPIIKFYNFSNP